jgi:peptidyl-tRNA hydrolase
LYVITRQDLSPGYQATQAAHAALAFSVEHPGLTRRWHDESNYLIVLAAPDEPSLLALLQRAESQGLRTTLFTEPDLNDEATALVIEPGLAAERLCANLPLALREEMVAVA